MKSLGAMVKQIAGLVGTRDVTQWEREFIESVVGWSNGGENTTPLTPKQIAVIERIYRKHFADADA